MWCSFFHGPLSYLVDTTISAYPVTRQTYGYIPSFGTSPPFNE